VHRWTFAAITVGLAFIGISWLSAAEYPSLPPKGDFEPRRLEPWMSTGPDADDRRHDALRRAVFELEPSEGEPLEREAIDAFRAELSTPVPACRFVNSEPSGTSAKFDCVFRGGLMVKVKYGRNPEIHAEAAATALLRALDYPADIVAIVPRLRCYGCPRFPFLAMHLQSAFGFPVLAAAGHDNGYTDFEWVAVERKFPAHPIETESGEGWSWWELQYSDAPAADVDAIRLLAVFLAHWDNKDQNQRLVCLDGPPPHSNAECARPLAMIQDVGGTFGPTKVNLARWRDLPVWHDPDACVVSMRMYPYHGASFADVQISEAGRARIAERLAALTDMEIERIFAEAQFPRFQVGTNDERDLEAWTDAFRIRANQIVDAGPCPDPPVDSQPPTTNSQTNPS
jgi:hypothetical protein